MSKIIGWRVKLVVNEDLFRYFALTRIIYASVGSDGWIWVSKPPAPTSRSKAYKLLKEVRKWAKSHPTMWEPSDVRLCKVIRKSDVP